MSNLIDIKHRLESLPMEEREDLLGWLFDSIDCTWDTEVPRNFVQGGPCKVFLTT